MRYVTILATFILMHQAVNPTPRPPKPAVAQQEGTKTDQQKAAGKGEVANPPAAAKAQPETTAKPRNQNPESVAPANQEKLVRVTAFPQVTTARDTPTLVVSAILALVGIGGIIVAICTVKYIARQTRIMRHQSRILRHQTTATWRAAKATAESVEEIRRQANQMQAQTAILEDSVKAAKDSASHIVTSERAWVVVLPDQDYDHPPNRIIAKVWNAGRTPARLIENVSRYIRLNSLSELPASPDYGTSFSFKRTVLVPTSRHDAIGTIRIQALLEPDGSFTQEDSARVGSRQLLLYFYGRITYEDTFGNQRHTAWGYVFYSPIASDPQPRPPRGFRPDGPDAYNDAS